MHKKTLKVIVDRPIGYKDSFGNIYRINYGYIPDIIAGDGEEQDAYILGVDEAISEYEGELVAIIHRSDDVEDKWVVSNKKYKKEEIERQVHFIEQYFHYSIEVL